jgi:hypothetical protein
MANPEHLARLKEGVAAWNGWRISCPDLIPDLSGADLSNSELPGAYFGRADLTRAILAQGNLTEANFTGARLTAADFTETELLSANFVRAHAEAASFVGASLKSVRLDGAFLKGTNFTKTILGGTVLSHADLVSANFTAADLNTIEMIGTKLEGTIFIRARMQYGIFVATDLSHTIGLETIQHYGPSMIDVDTLYRSKGKIPPEFLRGAGIPENLIVYIPSLTAPGAIQFYSCFISYSTKNQEFADRLHADLQSNGVRCWFAPHDVQGGKKLHEQIDEAIRRYERLLLILSPNSMSSKWVKTEIRNARKREVAEKKRVLFPVRLASYEALREWKLFDGDEGEDLATEIREYYIPDFSEWKNHDLYVREFEKLLRDLRTDGAAAVERTP